MAQIDMSREQREISILGRILANGADGMTAELAKHILSLGFSDQEKARMHDLAQRNQSGTLSSTERDELIAYANAGCLLGILHSKARKSLKRRSKVKA
jgi:hypothetical protein